jgi:hypothetical protein
VLSSKFFAQWRQFIVEKKIQLSLHKSSCRHSIGTHIEKTNLDIFGIVLRMGPRHTGQVGYSFKPSVSCLQGLISMQGQPSDHSSGYIITSTTDMETMMTCSQPLGEFSALHFLEYNGASEYTCQMERMCWWSSCISTRIYRSGTFSNEKIVDDTQPLHFLISIARRLWYVYGKM